MQEKLVLIGKVTNLFHLAESETMRSLAYLIHRIIESTDIEKDNLYEEVAKWQITLR